VAIPGTSSRSLRAGPEPGSEPRGAFAAITDRPILAGIAGATCIASSATLVRLADAEPATSAFFRCLYALPVLGLLALLENRRLGPRPLRDRALAAAAGLFFAVDLLFWHHAIAAVGAGIATVLGNLQVLVVGVLAWLLLGERPDRRLLYALPVVIGGVVLISGVVDPGRAYGEDPALGVVFGIATSIAYAAFLLVLRSGSHDLRRAAGPLFDATAVATVGCALGAPLSGGIDFAVRWPAHGWLVVLALSAQVLGWLHIAVSLPRLPAALTSLLLLLQPLASVALAGLVLAERPSVLQLVGCAVLLAGILVATRRQQPPTNGPAGESPAHAAARPGG
jgi:drug/metabolite transporter (DMT)-like permease